MGNENSGEAKTQAPPIAEPLENDLAKIEMEKQKRREAKLKAKENFKLSLDNANNMKPTSASDDRDAAQAARMKKKEERRAQETAEREQLGLVQVEEEEEVDELTRIRNNARRSGAIAKENSIDTLTTIDRQLEQTRNDNKKLHAIEQSLDMAESAMDELEKGIFMSYSSSNKVELPDTKSGDVTVPFEQWKDFITRYHKYTMRFTDQKLMRINHNNELKNTVAYSQVKAVHVKKEGFLDILFLPATGVDKWTIYTEGDVAQRLVKEMAQRKQDVGGELLVTFETGGPSFEYAPIKSVADREKEFLGGTGGRKATAKTSKRKSYLNDEANDAFLDDIMGDLNSLNNINKEVSHQLDVHQTELETQEGLVKNTNARLKPTLKRMDQWLES